VDCTGNTDSTAAYQAAVNAMPDAGTLYHPIGCKILLGTGMISGQCGITINSRVGVQFVSNVRVGNFGGGQTPQFFWAGNGGTMFCVNSTDHPRFIGLAFGPAPNGGNMDSCITFDGNPTNHVGTNGVVDYVACQNGENNNPNFVGISISPTAINNQENYEISHIYLNCSGSHASVRARDGVATAGSTTVSSARANFSATDVGKAINISYPGNNLQTTVASVPDAQHAVLAAAVPDAVTQATIITGQSYGVGLRNGASQNALQQTFSRITYNWCHVGVQIVGGGVQLEHINGGFSDTGISVGGFVAEQVSINWYEAENDLRGIDFSGPLGQIVNARLSNGNQYGDGFFRFGGGMVTIQGSFTNFNVPSGAVLIGAHGVPQLISIGNVWAGTWQQIGFDRFTRPPVISLGDNTQGGAPGMNTFGCWSAKSPCLQVNNAVPHQGGTTLQVFTSNAFANTTTSAIGLQLSDNLDMVGTYEAINSSASIGRISGENVLLRLLRVPTADPHVAGALWSNNGVLTVSAGP
jgi:hypothetical protein